MTNMGAKLPMPSPLDTRALRPRNQTVVVSLSRLLVKL
jgi:hypothetical protein